MLRLLDLDDDVSLPVALSIAMPALFVGGFLLGRLYTLMVMLKRFRADRSDRIGAYPPGSWKRLRNRNYAETCACCGNFGDCDCE